MNEETLKRLINVVCAVTTDSRTLEIAEWVTMTLPGRRKASEFLHHYLDGSGLPKNVNIAEVFRDDPGLQRVVLAAISKDIGGARTNGQVPLPQSAWSNTPAAQDWRYAIGSLTMDWKLISRLPDARKADVELSFRNEYRWHPKEARISQCVHKAAEDLKEKGAKDFFMIGDPYRIVVTF
jgi:hypothetical protein